MKRSKLTCLFLCAALLLSLFAGCTGGSGDGGPEDLPPVPGDDSAETPPASQEPQESGAEAAISLAEQVAGLVLPTPDLPLVDEPLTLTLMYPKTPSHGDFEGMFYLEAVEQLTGIKLDIQAIEQQGWQEKLGLTFASGDYGDIFINGVDFTSASIYGQAGMLLPLEDLLVQYSPNSQTIMELIPETRRNISADDGHIYAMPAYDGTPRDMLAEYSTQWNVAWMEALDMSPPSNVEELYELLTAFKNNDPNGNGEADEIPLSMIYDGDGTNMIITAFGFVNLRHDVIGGQYVYVPVQENFRHYLEYMNRLYGEGLLDSAYFTQSEEEYLAKRTEKLVGMGHGLNDTMTYEEVVSELANVTPLVSAYSSTPMHPGRFQEVDGFSLCITEKASEEKQIAAIRLLDYFYSEEGTYLIKCGPEYGAWGDMIDGGYVRNTGDDGSVSYELVYDKEKYTDSYYNFRIDNGLMNMPFFYTNAHADVIIGGDPKNGWLTDQVMNSGLLDARRVGYPTSITFSEDDQDILATYVMLDSYVDQMVARFITGEVELTDESWESYRNSVDMMDLDTLIQVRQEAYERWSAK